MLPDSKSFALFPVPVTMLSCSLFQCLFFDLVGVISLFSCFMFILCICINENDVLLFLVAVDTSYWSNILIVLDNVLCQLPLSLQFCGLIILILSTMDIRSQQQAFWRFLKVQSSLSRKVYVWKYLLMNLAWDVPCMHRNSSIWNLSFFFKLMMILIFW